MEKSKHDKALQQYSKEFKNHVQEITKLPVGDRVLRYSTLASHLKWSPGG